MGNQQDDHRFGLLKWWPRTEWRSPSWRSSSRTRLLARALPRVHALRVNRPGGTIAEYVVLREFLFIVKWWPRTQRLFLYNHLILRMTHLLNSTSCPRSCPSFG